MNNWFIAIDREFNDLYIPWWETNYNFIQTEKKITLCIIQIMDISYNKQTYVYMAITV